MSRGLSNCALWPLVVVPGQWQGIRGLHDREANLPTISPKFGCTRGFVFNLPLSPLSQKDPEIYSESPYTWL